MVMDRQGQTGISTVLADDAGVGAGGEEENLERRVEVS